MVETTKKILSTTNPRSRVSEGFLFTFASGFNSILSVILSHKEYKKVLCHWLACTVDCRQRFSFLFPRINSSLFKIRASQTSENGRERSLVYQNYKLKFKKKEGICNMAYINERGETQYSLKEKIAYHKDCINKGKDAKGNKLDNVQIHNHTKALERLQRQLRQYMKSYNAVTSVSERAKTPRKR